MRSIKNNNNAYNKYCDRFFLTDSVESRIDRVDDICLFVAIINSK
jgi:hypothetical protein